MNKKSLRINIVDILLLLGLLSIAVAAVMVFKGIGFSVAADAKEAVEIRYVVQFRNTREILTNNVVIGDIAVDARKRQQLGVAADVQVQDCYMEYYDYELNSMQNVPCPGYKDVFITLEALATPDGNGNYSVNGVNIAYGVGLDIHFPDFCKSGTVCAITVGGAK